MKGSVKRIYTYFCVAIFILSVIYTGCFIALIISLTTTNYDQFDLISNQPLAIIIWINIAFCLLFCLLSIALFKTTNSHLNKRAIQFGLLSLFGYFGIGFICLIYGIIIFRYVFIRNNFAKNSISYYDFIYPNIDNKLND